MQKHFCFRVPYIQFYEKIVPFKSWLSYFVKYFLVFWETLEGVVISTRNFWMSHCLACSGMTPPKWLIGRCPNPIVQGGRLTHINMIKVMEFQSDTNIFCNWKALLIQWNLMLVNFWSIVTSSLMLGYSLFSILSFAGKWVGK